ncbi:MAG: hypothetical protein DMG82_16345 [Acidobacteria bacterium]|nr:MAG: hypothetical protein DMG82_16345 [Acidobacteriota bacterium]
MAMSMGGGGASAPQMNVTPLIDVLLVLIIIFMVIVAQSKEKGFKADIPQPPTMPDSPQEVRTIVIQLREPKSGDKPVLKINQQEVSWADLKPQLASIFKQRAEKIAFVQGEDSVDFQYIADVIDTAWDAGVESARHTFDRRWGSKRRQGPDLAAHCYRGALDYFLQAVSFPCPNRRRSASLLSCVRRNTFSLKTSH